MFITRATRHTETTAVPHKFHGVFINPHQTDGVHIGENTTVESTGSHLTRQNQLNSDAIKTFCFF